MPIKNRIRRKKSAFLILSNANYLFRFFIIIIIITVISGSGTAATGRQGSLGKVRKKLMFEILYVPAEIILMSCAKKI